MKRDMDLIRLLLLELEGEDAADLSRYSEKAKAYHKYLLMDANLAVGADVTTSGDHPSALLHWLTWTGHDFLDAARDEGVWKKVTQATGSAAIDVIKSTLVAYSLAAAKGTIGLP